MTSKTLSSEELVHLVDPLLRELARLAMFERLVEKAFGDIPFCREMLQDIRRSPFFGPGGAISRPLEVIDIPEILADVNRALHAQLDQQARINSKNHYIAVNAFIAILCGRMKP